MGLVSFLKKNKFSFLISVLAILLFFWFCVIRVSNSNSIDQTVSRVLKGEISLGDVYKDPVLFHTFARVLGDQTPIGVRFETLLRRFAPITRYNDVHEPFIAYYTQTDWALAMLSYMPVKDVFGGSSQWQQEASLLMYQTKLQPIYGMENHSLEVNRELILRWQELLKKLKI